MLQSHRLNAKFIQCQKHYWHISQNLVDEPAQDRKCTDMPCVILLMIMLVSFIGIGVYSITEAQKIKFNVTRVDSQDDLITHENLVRWGVGIGSTIILSFLFLVLVKFFPRQVVYSMLSFTLTFLFSLTILGYFMNNLSLSILSGIALLIYSGILLCFWKVLKMGIFMLKFATDFLTEKPSTLILPIIKVILTSITTLFFLYSLTSINRILSTIDDQNSPQADFYSGLYGAQLFFGVSFIFIFYYMMNYVLSFVCANWYYGIQGSKASIKTGYKNMFKQIGSLMFGSLMITLSVWVRFLFNYYDFHQRCNCCACLDQYQARRCDFECLLCCCCSFSRQLCNQACFYFVRCVAEVFQVILQVIGNYTVIMMSISSQPYMEASKSVIGLAHNYFGFLGITNFISLYITISGVMFSVVLPSFLTYIIFDYQKPNSNQNTQSGVIIASSFLISLMILELIIQSICSLFVLYCMDKDFVKRQKIMKERLQQENHKAIGHYFVPQSETKDSIVTRNDNYQNLP